MFTQIFKPRQPKLLQPCEEWFLAHRHRLFAYARQQVDCMTDVELLLHDTARRVARAFSEGRVPFCDLMPYTLRSLKNAALDMRVANAHRLEAERRYGHEEGSSSTPAAIDSPRGIEDEHLILRRAVQQLPSELADVVTLRFWGEHSFAEIAAQLNLSEATARRRYETALLTIRITLTEQTHEPEER